MIIAKIIKLRGKIVHNNTVKKKRDKVKKKRDSRKFEPKIRTVPLKAGQLESIHNTVSPSLRYLGAIRALLHSGLKRLYTID